MVVGADISAATAGLNTLNQQLARTTASMNQLAPAAQNLQSTGGVLSGALGLIGTGLGFVGEQAGRVVGNLATAGAAVATLGTTGLVAFGASSFFAAARVSELDTTLRALATANGLNITTLNSTAASIQAMGIEAAAARQITALLVQNQLDLAKGTQLARVAQDAAVISGRNSTETTSDLIHGIVTLNTEVIRQAGITVDIDLVQRAYAKSLGISATALTTNQKQTAVLNAVLAQGSRIAGAYALAMEEPGKVMRSLPRVINDLQVAFGLALLPEFGPLIIAVFNLVKSMSLLGAEGKPLGIIFTAIGHAFAKLTTPLVGAITAFQKWLEALKPGDVKQIVDVIGGFSEVLGPLLGFILTVGAKALPIVGKLVAGFSPLGVALGIFALQSGAVRGALGGLLERITTFLGKADFRKVGEAVKQVFAGDFGTAVQLAISFLDDLFPGVSSIGPLFQKVFAGDIGGALEDFKGLLIAALPGAEGFINLAGQVADAVGRFAGDVGAGLTDFFTVKLPPILEAIAAFKDDAGGKLLGFFNDVVLPIANTLGQFKDEAGDGLKTFFTVTLPPILEKIGEFAGGVGDDMLVFFTQTLPPIAQTAAQFGVDVGSGLLTFFTVTLPPILEEIGKFSGDAVAPLVAFFNEHVPVIVAGLGTFAGDLGVGMVKFFTVDLPQIVASAGTVTADTFQKVVDFFQTQGPLIIAGAQQFTTAPIQPVADFFSNFGGIATQVQSLGPFFEAVNNFGVALGRLSSAVAGLLERSFGALLQNEFRLLGLALSAFFPAATAASPMLADIGTKFETLGQKLSGAAGLLNIGTAAINGLAGAIEKLQTVGDIGVRLNPDLFNGNINPGTPVFAPSPADAGAAAGGKTVNVNINTGDINGDSASIEAILQNFAAHIADAAERVFLPPDNPGVPQLAP